MPRKKQTPQQEAEAKEIQKLLTAAVILDMFLLSRDKPTEYEAYSDVEFKVFINRKSKSVDSFKQASVDAQVVGPTQEYVRDPTGYNGSYKTVIKKHQLWHVNRQCLNRANKFIRNKYVVSQYQDDGLTAVRKEKPKEDDVDWAKSVFINAGIGISDLPFEGMRVEVNFEKTFRSSVKQVICVKTMADAEEYQRSIISGKQPCNIEYHQFTLLGPRKIDNTTLEPGLIKT